MSSSSYLADKVLKISAKSIPWEGYQRAGLLSQEEVTLIQRVAGQSHALTEAILEAEGEAYADLYIRLLNKLSRADTLQFILVLVGEMLADRDDRISLFLNLAPYTPLLKLLDSQDEFTRLQSSVLVATLLSNDPKPPASAVSKLIGHAAASLRDDKEKDGQEVAVQCMEIALRVDQVRVAVWETESAKGDAPKVIAGLVALLKKNPTTQMQYQLAFCFWILTFNSTIATHINSSYNIIPLLSDLIRSSTKEKVVRCVVATFRNLIVNASQNDANLAAMLVAKLLPLVQSLASRMWSDEEIKEDLDFLVEQLKDSFEGLTTYDEYVSELKSGQLSWTPTHKNDEFWLDNAAKLNESEHQQLKVLINLLLSSRDSLVLAVAANDIAQYVKYCPTGKSAVNDLGAKDRLIHLMAQSDSDPDVKYQSLVAVQRLISHSWVST